ncbi:ABC transporter substrate-binding protein [Nakamurella antarctica]|uniref:ABC transporter substrate-binding protein n=1 Tax=Nakamurella antarctica TaxID=1902245 RepID=A0A3G8ZW13_9ACTN|nr:ABC transporter substrate-binding protein [Nakamurella antarctica]AZI58206.1 ABC transporter substrate-binding protein [Nakamurella antarctica]
MNPMRSRLRVIGALSITTALALAGCSSSDSNSSPASNSSAPAPGSSSSDASSAPAGDAAAPISGGTLSVGRGNLFEGFNLDQETVNASFQLSEAVLEPLIRVNAEGTDLAPGIASKWTFNADNTVLTIDLTPKVTFSNGDPVTPEDVAFSIKTWQAGPSYGPIYGGIEKTVIVDADTIELDLSGPDSTLPNYLAWSNAGIVPKDFGGRTAEEFWQAPIGAGPFLVESWASSGDVVLTKNPKYYKAGQPYLDKVVSSYSADSNSLSLQLKAAQIDVADELSPVIALGLDQSLILPVAEHNTAVLLMNTKDPALSDPIVRQAIGYALDYPSILKSVYSGYGSAPTGALPSNLLHWAPPSSPYFSRDVEKAKALLATAANPPTTLEFLFTANGDAVLLGQILADNLKDIGITVTLTPVDSGQRSANLDDGKYQLASFAYNAISPDVTDPISYVTSTDGMRTGFSSDVVDAQFKAYQLAKTPAEQEKAIGIVQDVYFKEAPFIALAHLRSLGAAQPTVKGLQLTLWGTYALENVWKTN